MGKLGTTVLILGCTLSMGQDAGNGGFLAKRNAILTANQKTTTSRTLVSSVAQRHEVRKNARTRLSAKEPISTVATVLTIITSLASIWSWFDKSPAIEMHHEEQRWNIQLKSIGINSANNAARAKKSCWKL